MTTKADRALKHLYKARELAKKLPNPFKDMTEEQIIAKLRETREKLWREKYAPSARH
ncbi:MAG: hypothetical protein HQL13_01165 [Candidatus Omnitrophica bacterium]|nr:hypothetical protein [Candidatus Omnitrophota bacterium]